jgi:hypothetical protein
MVLKAMKAGPVATGTDLRKSDLAINSEDIRTVRSLQVATLTRRCAISVALAAVVAPLVFGEGGR